MRPSTTIKHPLEDVALKAFAKCECQDSSSLGYFLAGACVTGASRAYRKVALDILGYMESQGKLERDNVGWWRLTETKETVK
jgi:hypothetical protein